MNDDECPPGAMNATPGGDTFRPDYGIRKGRGTGTITPNSMIDTDTDTDPERSKSTE